MGKGKRAKQVPWRGAAGLAHDIRYYGQWMRERAWERIGHLYPTAKLPDSGEATVIAWLWARTIHCRNPACGIAMPLMKTFQLSTKSGNEHWTRPIVDSTTRSVSFVVQNSPEGIPASATATDNGGAICVACNEAVPSNYVQEQGKSGLMGEVLTAIVAEGNRKRLFLSPTRGACQSSINSHPRMETH